jgi:hypothetical protein
MAGYSLAAVAAFASKVYGYIKGIYDLFSDESDIAGLIDKAKDEILDKIVETDHLEVKDRVEGYINTFKTLPHLPPAHQNLGGFIANGFEVLARLETYLIEREKKLSRGEAYVYEHDGKYAYHDAAAYNLVILIQASAMKMASAGDVPICALYRRAYAVNFELLGEPTSQPLPFAMQGGYTSPSGVRCFLVSRLWQYLYQDSFEKWNSNSLTIVCQPCHHKYLTTHSYIPSVYAKGISGGSYALEGPASQAQQKKCLDLFRFKFENDPVVQHVADANTRLLDLLGSCEVNLRAVIPQTQNLSFSVRSDIYGLEKTDRGLREMCELHLGRHAAP